MARGRISEWFQTATHAQKAMWMSAICGVKVTETDVKNAKRRGAGAGELAGCITELNDDDRRFLMTWFGFALSCRRHSNRLDAVCAWFRGGWRAGRPAR